MVCHYCDMVTSNNLRRFVHGKSKVVILDCQKCGGLKSRFMFTIDGLSNE